MVNEMDDIKTLRATETWQRAGAYSVRIQGMICAVLYEKNAVRTAWDRCSELLCPLFPLRQAQTVSAADVPPL